MRYNFLNKILQNTARPEGFWGRMMLRGMNFFHSFQSKRGLSTVEWEPDWHVLDIGCGGGADLKRLLKLCHRGQIYGIDISEESVRFSRRRNSKELEKRCFISVGNVLTTEFCAGKIVSYVHPMKLLMFITVVFFLFFFMFYGGKLDSALGSSTESMDELAALEDMIGRGTMLDSIDANNVTVAIVTDSTIVSDHSKLFRIIGTKPSVTGMADGNGGNSIRTDTVTVRASARILEEAAYSHIGEWNGIPLLKFNRNYNSAVSDRFTIFKERVTSAASGYAPLTALLLIPLLALMLKAIYRKCRIPYMGHFVFSLHFASFFFILLSLYLTAGELWRYDGPTLTAFLLLILVYMTAASHHVYSRTGWIKATVKSAFVLSAYFFTVAVIIIAVLAYLIYAEKDILIDVAG